MTEREIRVDVDWGGDHVNVTIEQGLIEVSAAIPPAVADRMIRQLTWAAKQVRDFAAHMEDGRSPALFDTRGKPS